MGCCHSFSSYADTSDIVGNDFQDDTVPLASAKKKSKQEKNRLSTTNSFARMIPLLEERGHDSTFENVNEHRRLSINSFSSSSTISLEHEIANSAKTNEFLHQILDDSRENMQNSNYQSNIQATPNRQAMNSTDFGLLYTQADLIMSTDDEGGISGEMDSSNDDS